jgi:hypothetical protein
VRRGADVVGIQMREEQSRVGRNEETRGERGRRMVRGRKGRWLLLTLLTLTLTPPIV